MGLQHPVGVEMVMMLEQRTPDYGHEHRRDEKLRVIAQACLAELAARDATIDQPAQGLEPTRDDIVEVEGGELGMLVAFGNQQTHDDHAPRAHQLLDEFDERPFEEVFDGERGRLHLVADHVEMGGDDAAHHRLEQLFLGLEVEIGETLGDFRARRHVLEPRAGIALDRELLEGGRHDLLRAIVFSYPPAGAAAAGLLATGLLAGGRSRLLALRLSHGSDLSLLPIQSMTDWSVPQWVSEAEAGNLRKMLKGQAR